uniref:Uncharacterized protein n=1 Tax=Globodera rostochiensis TaxID=31243 RepID=A0A914I2Q7_GLORO
MGDDRRTFIDALTIDAPIFLFLVANSNLLSFSNQSNKFWRFKRMEDIMDSDNDNVAQRKLYKADENPPLPLTFLFGLQQVMVSVSVLVSIPFLISDEVCPGKDRDQLRVRLIAGTFVVCGLGTILQTALGLRLALLQGVAFAYIPSVRAYMNLEGNRCTATINDYVPPEVYENKLAIVQGTLVVVSILKVFVGATGFIGKMTKYIGPMTVSSLLILLMLESVTITVKRMEQHWISLIMAVALFATVLYLPRVQVPCPAYVDGKCKFVGFNVFGQFPYLTAILFSWFLCWLMTVFELIPKDSVARTDKNTTMLAIQNAPWVRVPLPGQFGMPKFNAGLFLAFIISGLTTMFEAVGNYHAVARISEERPPPSHAINRGIIAEGLGCLIAALIGPCVGITTHAENVGVIGITRVASRVTMIFGGLTMIAFGLFTKLGAVLSAIPDPLVGVVLATSMAMVGGVAIANVQAVNLRITRNIAILGFSLMMGMVIPEYYKRNPGTVKTGVMTLDQMIEVLMSLPMFVGSFTAFVLDNTVGGATRQQRGLRERGVVWELAADGRDIYAFPGPLQRAVEAIPLLKHMPFIPRHKKDFGNIKTG